MNEAKRKGGKSTRTGCPDSRLSVSGTRLAFLAFSCQELSTEASANAEAETPICQGKKERVATAIGAL